MAYLLGGGTPRVSTDGDWSESYACDFYDWHLKVQQGLPWLAGAVLLYQTAAWTRPAQLTLAVVEKEPVKVTVEATLLDAAGILCLDARNVVRFTLAGGGRLVDNQGTSSGSKVVQMYNGRARITILLDKGTSTAGVSSEGLPTTFCTL